MSDKAPFFSCVIPVKGGRPFIKDALASLEAQGLGEELEVIVQDGDVDSRVERVGTCRGGVEELSRVERVGTCRGGVEELSRVERVERVERREMDSRVERVETCRRSCS